MLITEQRSILSVHSVADNIRYAYRMTADDKTLSVELLMVMSEQMNQLVVESAVLQHFS